MLRLLVEYSSVSGEEVFREASELWLSEGDVNPDTL